MRIIKYLLLIHEIYSIIVLPFQISGLNKTEKNYSINSLINDIFYRDLFTIITIGTPPKEVLTLIRPDNKTIFLNKNDCERKKLDFLDKNLFIFKNKEFNYKESSSFQTISTINLDYNNDNYNFLVKDFISFSDISCLNNTFNCQSKITFEKFSFIVERFYTNKLCARLGIGYSKNSQLHIINQLKKKKEVNNYLMTLKFMNNMEGKLIFGGYPHEYENNEIFDPNNLIKIYTGSIGNVLIPWSLSFNFASLVIDEKEIIIQKYALCYLVFNFGLIKGTEKYKEYILNYYFQELIDKNICKMEKTDKTIFDRKASSINSNGIYSVFTCDKKDFKNNYIYKFPTLKLIHQGFNYTFELNYKDLFMEINNKYYFLVIFPGDDSYQWIFGIPFLQKYEFIFNYDEYTIGFYQNYLEIKEKIEKRKEKKDNNYGNNKKSLKIFFEICFCIILILLGYLIGKKIHERRKLKANELADDDYEYSSENGNYKIFDKNDSLIQKKNIKKEKIVNSNNKSLELSIKF